MNRRHALAFLISVVPTIAFAQSRRKIPVIGLPLIFAGPNDAIVRSLREGLRERGYIDGDNIRIEHRFGEGKIERLNQLVRDLVRDQVDVFVAGAAPIARAQREASPTIPIVLVAWDYDPMTTGLVETLSRPGGNVTGIHPRTTETLGKRLELVRELLPRLSRVAAIYDRWGKGQVPLLEAPASQLGLRLQPIELAEPYNYEEAFRGAKAKGLEAVLVTFSPYFYVHRAKLVEAALAASMPTIFPEESAVRVGGLMSYGPDATATWKRAGYFIDRILKGEKASDLPMEQPQVFRLVINMKSAKALRIEVPQSLMVRADVLIG